MNERRGEKRDEQHPGVPARDDAQNRVPDLDLSEVGGVEQAGGHDEHERHVREQEDGDARDGGPGEPAGDFEDAAFDEQGSEKRTAPPNDSAMSREVYFVIRVVNAALPGMRSTSEMVWRTFSRSWSPSTVSLRASSFASRSLMSGSVGPCVEASGSCEASEAASPSRGTGAIGAAAGAFTGAAVETGSVHCTPIEAAV